MPSWIKFPPSNYCVKKNCNGQVYFVHENSSIHNNSVIGRFSYIHGNTRTTGNKPLLIGSFCSIASEVKLHCGDEHDYRRISTFPFKTILGLDFGYDEVMGNGISIGHDVWIGEGVRILSGSSIGNGAVLGAGSIIKGVVEPYSVMVGNPSICIRTRCSPAKILILNRVQWWNWPIDKIQRNSHFFGLNLATLSDSEFETLCNRIA